MSHSETEFVLVVVVVVTGGGFILILPFPLSCINTLERCFVQSSVTKAGCHSDLRRSDRECRDSLKGTGPGPNVGRTTESPPEKSRSKYFGPRSHDYKSSVVSDSTPDLRTPVLGA